MIEKDNDMSRISKFDLDFLTPNQFMNILNNYSHSPTLKSEYVLNRLVNFLKDNYMETRKEKDQKMTHVKNFFLLQKCSSVHQST